MSSKARSIERAGVTGGCEPPDMHDRSQTQVLLKSNECS